jgi:hypothetical protein
VPHPAGGVVKGVAELAASLAAAGPLKVSLRQGTIQAAAATVLTARLGGSTTDVAGVHFLDSYLPIVGDTAWFLQSGPDLLAIGKVGTGNSPSIGTHTDSMAYGGSTAAGAAMATLISKSITTGLTGALILCRSNWDLDFTIVGTSYVNGYLRINGGADVFTVAEQDFAVHRQPSLRGRDVVFLPVGAGSHTIDMRYNKNNAGGTCLISNNTRTDFEGFW